MVRTGKVVEAKRGMMKVCFDRPEACQHCNACAGQKHHTLAKIPGDAPVGSFVDVEMPQGQVLKASLLAYVVPMILLIAGIAVGLTVLKNEVAAALLGVGMMVLSYLLLKLMEKRLGKDPAWRPRVIAVREEGENRNGNEVNAGEL